MIINIDDELFHKVKQIVKSRDEFIFEQLEQLKPLEAITTNTNTLQTARDIKTQRVKQSIKETIQELLSKDISPTKYKVHKATGIAFITLKKHYDGILEDIKR